MAPASRTIDNVSGTALVPATQLAGRTRRCKPRSSYVPLQKKAGVLHIKFAVPQRGDVAASAGHPSQARGRDAWPNDDQQTLDIYSHVTLDMQQEAADAMDRLFRAADGT
jgi:hypothetical protein